MIELVSLFVGSKLNRTTDVALLKVNNKRKDTHAFFLYSIMTHRRMKKTPFNPSNLESAPCNQKLNSRFLLSTLRIQPTWQPSGLDSNLKCSTIVLVLILVFDKHLTTYQLVLLQKSRLLCLLIILLLCGCHIPSSLFPAIYNTDKTIKRNLKFNQIL